MFAITSKATYGIAAVLELAGNYGNGLLQIRDIAERREIPRHYLVQLLNRLIKSGLVRSVRGIKGGYELNEHPANISFLQVLELLEGKIQLTESYPGEDAIRELFTQTESEIKKIFEISLAELLAKQHQYAESIMFFI